MSDPSRSVDALEAVRRADEAVWKPGSGMTLAARNSAVQAALAEGWTPREIADRVRVTTSDVERWAGLAPA